MDDEVARLDDKARRVQSAIGAVAAAMLGYVGLLIVVFSMVTTPLPDWIAVVMIPCPIFFVVVVVLRVAHASLVGDAAKAQVRALMRTVDELERDIDNVRREGGREGH